MKTLFTKALTVVALGALTSLPANADIVTWNFAGQITSHIPSPLPGGPFLPPVGTNFSGSITFTTTPTGVVSSDGTHAEWDIATISSFSLDGPASVWNNITFPITQGSIAVDNSATLDRLLFRLSEGEFQIRLDFQQHGTNPSALSSVIPPCSPPALGLFDVATFSFTDIDVQETSAGVITSLTGPSAVCGRRSHDFNGDARSDIAWRQTSTGAAALWLMNGAAILQSGGLGTVPNNWQIVGQRDFNGDGKSDLLWRDT